MKYWISFLCVLISTSSLATGQINFLEVKDDVVLFSLDTAKTSSPPGCVAPNNTDFWSVSLSTHTGRAMYSLILTAMAKENGVGLNVTSGNDCAALEGYERAEVVNLETIGMSGDSQSDTGPSSENVSGTTIGMYHSDGTTRIGTVITVTNTNSWWYLPTNGDGSFVSYGEVIMLNSLYFSEANCEGYVLSQASNGLARPFKAAGNRYLRRPNSTRFSNDYESRSDVVDGNMVCTNESSRVGNVSLFEYAENELCGESVCIARPD